MQARKAVAVPSAWPSRASSRNRWPKAIEVYWLPRSLLIRRRGPFASRDAARLAVFHYLEAFYNPLRRHSTLGYLSPDEYETMYRTNHPERETSAA